MMMNNMISKYEEGVNHISIIKSILVGPTGHILQLI